MLPPAIFRPAQFRAANALTFVVNGALGGFAFVFIPALEIIAGRPSGVARAEQIAEAGLAGQQGTSPAGGRRPC